MEFPTIDKFAKEVAEKALDEITYEGKTVREWTEIIVKQQPCEDCISREEVRRILGNEVFELMKLHTVNPEDNPKADAMSYGVNWSLNTLMELPSVTPQPSEEDIHREREQAYMLGYEDASKKFRTEPCEDCISREALKQKLQEEHDFFVNAYGGFSNLPQNDKARVDEITNCIAMVVNEPPVKPKYTDEEIDKAQAVEQAYVDKMVELAVEEIKRPKGKWIFHKPFDDGHKNCNECIECNQCHTWLGYDCYAKSPCCPYCGAKMEGEKDV